VGVEILLLLILVVICLVVFGKLFANLVRGAVAFSVFLVASIINLAAFGRRALRK
jgi:hypothetical protein